MFRFVGLAIAILQHWEMVVGAQQNGHGVANGDAIVDAQVLDANVSTYLERFATFG